MIKEELLSEIVDTVSGPVSVLLGAGASAAFGLPTMVSFLEKSYGTGFIDKIENCPPYKIGSNNISENNTNKTATICRLFHTASLGKEKVDIDLESLFSFAHHTGISNSNWSSDNNIKDLFLFHRVCADGSKVDFAGFKNWNNSQRPLISRWMTDVSDAITDLRRRMHEAFLITRADYDVTDNASHLYDRVFTELFTHQAPVIFTVNFDTIFEAVDDAKTLGWDLVDGIQEATRSRYFNFKNFLESTQSTNPFYLFKLHGSVTWSRDNGEIRDTYPDILPVHNSEALALAEPVISKQSQDDPFKTMYKIFEATLAQNEVCVVIGTSLRDDNLRSVLERRLVRKNKPFKLILLAPEEEEHSFLNYHLENLSHRNNVIWIKEKFADDKIVDLLAKEAWAPKSLATVK